jgi:hypothetical protein
VQFFAFQAATPFREFHPESKKGKKIVQTAIVAQAVGFEPMAFDSTIPGLFHIKAALP